MSICVLVFRSTSFMFFSLFLFLRSIVTNREKALRGKKKENQTEDIIIKRKTKQTNTEERLQTERRKEKMTEIERKTEEACLVLDRATEQMATLQREDHSGDITTLRLKSPLEHTHTHTVAKGKVFLFVICVCARPKHILIFFFVPTRPTSFYFVVTHGRALRTFVKKLH